ncbi:MAG: RdgB/HAM1 family non-canonical purine NTP pyrophosphatase [Flavobacteriales bacterium]
MTELVLATNNPKKVREIQARWGNDAVRLFTLQEAGITEELPETHETLRENALEKAQYVYERTGKWSLADDSGLEIEALDGRPGVYSARYAGEHGNAEANMQKVLSEMEGAANRRASFKTVLALETGDISYFFEGEIQGMIIPEKRGTGGFGYDPIFVPDGYTKTFAEMDPDEKNAISHRSLAVDKLLEFLKNS